MARTVPVAVIALAVLAVATGCRDVEEGDSVPPGTASNPSLTITHIPPPTKPSP
ncbi:hypothetical protein B0I31_101123 [Saccharothrix carnea]|uniref:Lipoprotein n=1 Tax=Saccharothrix carnea TaxID=1280637 RepID=A0A2P8IHG1_SACCR|nr:hypothetical protein [Saccharothrix carnea]PSL57909.1 hypothetical protein B0I31_101123 [Saccharothrix carnea]